MGWEFERGGGCSSRQHQQVRVRQQQARFILHAGVSVAAVVLGAAIVSAREPSVGLWWPGVLLAYAARLDTTAVQGSVPAHL
jgi:hypothetical protein